MVEIGILEGVFDKTGRLLARIEDDQWELPTPCPDYDVGALAEHLVGFLRTFAAAVSGEPDAPEPSRADGSTPESARVRPAPEFRVAADLAVAAWHDGAAGRRVTVGSDDVPGAVAFDLMLVECVTHGWDLATATGQPAAYTDAEAEAALAAVTPMLGAESRGPGQGFGPAVPVPAGAGPLARLVGFLGRRHGPSSPC